jgi:protein gp37
LAENSKIEWTDHSFSPWIGCTRVSPACDHCYAADMAKRYGWAKWGHGEIRRFAATSTWKQTLAWNRKAQRDGVRRRVFCSHLSDVFDAEVDDEWRVVLTERIHETSWLDWLLLTKRPKVAAQFFDDVGIPSNVWMGTTVENQAMADLRIPILLSIPAKVRFLSCEPLLGPVDLSRCGIHYTGSGPLHLWRTDLEGNGGWRKQFCEPAPEIHWVITGGESGPKARPSHPDWFRSLRDQCAAAGVPFFFKQNGEHVPVYDRDRDDPDWRRCNEIERNTPRGQWLNLAGGQGFHGDRVVRMDQLGKAKAGALLDGREHREFHR